MKYEVSCIFT